MFRQGLVRGDVEIIHPILMWLLTHIDVVQKRAYLSRFLVKVMSKNCSISVYNYRKITNNKYSYDHQIEIPPEYLGDSEISLLHEQYLSMVDRFKAVHKEREIGKKVKITVREF